MALATGYKPPEAARSLGVGGNLIRGRKREFEEETTGTRLDIDGREELNRLRMEKEILKNQLEFNQSLLHLLAV